MKVISILLFLLLPIPPSAEELGTQLSRRSLQPMNRPMGELGVTSHDTTLCSDRWYTCSSYDRQQFDQKHPGVPLNELLRYGEPTWPDRDCTRLDDSLDIHDRLDKN